MKVATEETKERVKKVLILAIDARGNSLSNLIASSGASVDAVNTEQELHSLAQRKGYDIIALPYGDRAANHPSLLMASLTRRSKKGSGLKFFFLYESCDGTSASPDNPASLHEFKNVVHLRSNGFFAAGDVSDAIQECMDKREVLLNYRRVSGFIAGLISTQRGQASLVRSNLIDIFGEAGKFDLHWLPLLAALVANKTLPLEQALEITGRLRGEVDELYLDCTVTKIYLSANLVKEGVEHHTSMLNSFIDRLVWLDQASCEISGDANPQDKNSRPNDMRGAIQFARDIRQRIMDSNIKSFEILEALAGRGVFFDALVHFLNNESVVASKCGNPRKAIASGTTAVDLCIRQSESVYLCYNLALYHINLASELTAIPDNKRGAEEAEGLRGRAEKLLKRCILLNPTYTKATNQLASLKRRKSASKSGSVGAGGSSDSPQTRPPKLRLV